MTAKLKMIRVIIIMVRFRLFTLEFPSARLWLGGLAFDLANPVGFFRLASSLTCVVASVASTPALLWLG